eukprot:12900991-Prorocentrum_lima.AAC.1
MLHDSVRTRLRCRTMGSTQSTRVIGGCFNTKIANFQRNLRKQCQAESNMGLSRVWKSTAVQKTIAIAFLY